MGRGMERHGVPGQVGCRWYTRRRQEQAGERGAWWDNGLNHQSIIVHRPCSLRRLLGLAAHGPVPAYLYAYGWTSVDA
jgi:hypothetical protein